MKQDEADPTAMSSKQHLLFNGAVSRHWSAQCGMVYVHYRLQWHRPLPAAAYILLSTMPGKLTVALLPKGTSGDAWGKMMGQRRLRH